MGARGNPRQICFIGSFTPKNQVAPLYRRARFGLHPLPFFPGESRNKRKRVEEGACLYVIKADSDKKIAWCRNVLEYVHFPSKYSQYLEQARRTRGRHLRCSAFFPKGGKNMGASNRRFELKLGKDSATGNTTLFLYISLPQNKVVLFLSVLLALIGIYFPEIKSLLLPYLPK